MLSEEESMLEMLSPPGLPVLSELADVHEPVPIPVPDLHGDCLAANCPQTLAWGCTTHRAYGRSLLLAHREMNLFIQGGPPGLDKVEDTHFGTGLLVVDVADAPAGTLPSRRMPTRCPAQRPLRKEARGRQRGRQQVEQKKD